MLNCDLGNIYQKRNAVSRSISAENPTGDVRGGAKEVPTESDHPSRELGKGWKVKPCIDIKAGETATIMDIDGPGVIRHIWVTLDAKLYRDIIIRVYWDNQDFPSIESPIGDFFCCSWNKRQNILGHPINVNPSGGMNMFFPMPFKKHAKITIENDSVNDLPHFFYTINYTLENVPEDALYFHANWKRMNPTEYQKEYIIIDNIKGCGQYVGTFVSWQQNSSGWWGEGEIKMFIDDDKPQEVHAGSVLKINNSSAVGCSTSNVDDKGVNDDLAEYQGYPTICGTGTEDYFGGAWCFDDSFSAPYFGFLEVEKKTGDVGARMTMYRFHVHDPVYFKKSFDVTMQALGWRSEGRFLPLQDDIASVAYWYQTLPGAPFEKIADRNSREII